VILLIGILIAQALRKVSVTGNDMSLGRLWMIPEFGNGTGGYPEKALSGSGGYPKRQRLEFLKVPFAAVLDSRRSWMPQSADSRCFWDLSMRAVISGELASRRRITRKTVGSTPAKSIAVGIREQQMVLLSEFNRCVWG